MPTIFTRIIQGELPGHFIWKDAKCVAFLSIHPLKPGHTLVVPRQEVDHWLELDPELSAHLFGVAQTIGKALQEAFQPEKVGLMLAGLEVPHTHIHLVPINGVRDLDFANQDTGATAEALNEAAAQIRKVLEAQGQAGGVL